MADSNAVRDTDQFNLVAAGRSGQRSQAGRTALGVPRRDLLARIDQNLHQIVCIVAPAGFGKSMLLEQWRSRSADPVAVVRFKADACKLDVVGGCLAYSLLEAALIDDAAARAIAAAKTPSAVSRLTTAALAGREQPSVVLLDNVEVLGKSIQCELIGGFADTLPASVRLGLASREHPSIGIGALRGTGRILELGIADLAMDVDEAREMLSMAGLGAGPRIPDLVERTEGWPVAIRLGSLALSANNDPNDKGLIYGSDTFIADYLESEVLKPMPADVRSFLARSSILETMNGSLCDAVLEREGSAALLHSVAGWSPAVIAVDREATWYRMPQLLVECLRSNQQAIDGTRVCDAHRRAATWFETNGRPDEAIAHAHACHDEDAEVRIVSEALRGIFSAGEFDVASHWLDRFDSAAVLPRSQQLLAVGTLAYALLGTDAAFQRWNRALLEAAENDGETNALTHLIRAICRPESLQSMALAVDACTAALPASSEWWTAAELAGGLVAMWSGDDDQADRMLAAASGEGLRYGSPIAASIALAARATIALSNDDQFTARSLADRAVKTVVANKLENLSTSALAFAVGSRSTALCGDLAAARILLDSGLTPRSHLSGSLQPISILVLVETAKAHLAIADVAGARHAARESFALSRTTGDFGRITSQVQELNETIAGMPAGSVGVSTLTDAELRVLPYLASHLSFPEIGAALFISRHTVKSHAMAIYRKLGASSRSEAVNIARQDRLINDRAI